MDPSMARSIREALEAPEVEVMPGVFLTDFRSRNAELRKQHTETPEGTMPYLDDIEQMDEKELLEIISQLKNAMKMTISPEDKLQAIEYQIKELETQIENLKRSNNEILKVMKTDSDPILKESVEENLKAMATKTEKLKDLKALLKTLRSQYDKGADTNSSTRSQIDTKSSEKTECNPIKIPSSGALNLLDSEGGAEKESNKEKLENEKTDLNNAGENEDEGIFL